MVGRLDFSTVTNDVVSIHYSVSEYLISHISEYHWIQDYEGSIFWSSVDFQPWGDHQSQSLLHHLHLRRRTFNQIFFLVPTGALVVMMRHYRPESGEYIQIFEYSNIFVRNIYSDIHLSQFCLYKYIWTFVCECENSNIWIFIQFSIQFFHLEIHLCQICLPPYCFVLLWDPITFLQLELFVHQC